MGRDFVYVCVYVCMGIKTELTYGIMNQVESVYVTCV
jgi:hypothetical protein